jgi:hypothetical protein
MKLSGRKENEDVKYPADVFGRPVTAARFNSSPALDGFGLSLHLSREEK